MSDYSEAKKKAVAEVVKNMKERAALKNLTEEQWEMISHYVNHAFIDGKDYAVEEYILKRINAK